MVALGTIMATALPLSLLRVTLASTIMTQQEQEEQAVLFSPSPDMSREWTPDMFQLSDNTFCQSDDRLMRTCWDPDNILVDNDKHMIALNDALQATTMFASPCPDDPHQQEMVPLQVAVAVIGKMRTTDDEPETIDKTVQVFAQSIHDQWGVGEQTRCGGTGVLIFLAVQDRAIYISRGDALKRSLTDRRIDSVIQHMTPELQQQQYAKALAEAIWEIRARVDKGPLSRWEQLGDVVVQYSGFMAMSTILSLMFWGVRQQGKRKRDYAKVKSQLSELDRSRAEALQGRFLAVSCPICLEVFQRVDNKSEEESLTCQHEHDSNVAVDTAYDLSKMRGSDGLPLKLLHCGHVFDETCWDEWVRSGRGEVTRCPICKKDVGKPETSLTLSPNNEDTSTSQNVAPRPRQNYWALQRYMDDRYFRLQRLQFRYPAYVDQHQVSRWSQTSYNEPLATDRSFVERDPRHQQSSQTGSSTFSNASESGFGGGTSGGGRSGRW